MRRASVVRRARPFAGAVALALLAGCGGSGGDQTRRVSQAVRAPVHAFMDRNAAALCAAFTPAVAEHLAPGDRTCVRGASSVFARMHGVHVFYGRTETVAALPVSDISVHGDTAQARTAWPWPQPRRTVTVQLREQGGAWRISSDATLVEQDFKDFCRLRLFAHRPCPVSYALELGTHPARVMIGGHGARKPIGG